MSAIAAVRRFNRFYTRRIGVLQEGHLQSPFSLATVRVMYELAHRDGLTATVLGKELGLDAGYLSRILRDLEARKLIVRKTSAADGRQSFVELTKRGRAAFGELNDRTDDEIGALVGTLSPAKQRQLLEAMHTVEALLDGGAPRPADAPAYTIRSHRPGDMGWVVHRHGALYAQEYGYDEQFEALVARITADFIDDFDPARERCWLAERDGEIVGSVFLVAKSKTVAKLRLLLVEPSARGLGIGHRLVDECVRFAEQAGYRKIVLWTQQSLLAARRIYETAGFRLVAEEPHHSFGLDLVAETWERRLP
jgi:DNA-binding MarR family transcriptional regulator/GNAT superfamily N-acetyltransferase